MEHGGVYKKGVPLMSCNHQATVPQMSGKSATSNSKYLRILKPDYHDFLTLRCDSVVYTTERVRSEEETKFTNFHGQKKAQTSNLLTLFQFKGWNNSIKSRRTPLNSD